MRLSNVTYDLSTSHGTSPQPTQGHACMGLSCHCQPLCPSSSAAHFPTLLFPTKNHLIITTFHPSTAQHGPGASPWHLPALRS